MPRSIQDCEICGEYKKQIAASDRTLAGASLMIRLTTVAEMSGGFRQDPGLLADAAKFITGLEVGDSTPREVAATIHSLIDGPVQRREDYTANLAEHQRNSHGILTPAAVQLTPDVAIAIVPNPS